MTNFKNRTEYEKSIIKDPKTGREIWRMTNYDTHDIHPYYDSCSWNPEGKKIVFTSILPEVNHLDKEKITKEAALFIMNEDGSDIECLVEGVDATIHTGCFPIWKDERTIIYTTGGKTCIIDINTKEIIKIDSIVGRFLSPDGSKLVCHSKEKPGVVILDLENFSQKKIISGKAVTEIMFNKFNRNERNPDIDRDRIGSPVLANLKWSPDGTTLMLRFNFTPGEYMKSLFTFKVDGTELKRLDIVPTRFSHHSWHPDGNRILHVGESPVGRRYFLVDKDGLTRKPIYKETLGSHPCFNPGGTEIVDFSKGYIYHLNLKTNKVEKLASYTNDLPGLHAHPSWSPDGTKIMYHSDHTGNSQIYIIPLY